MKDVLNILKENENREYETANAVNHENFPAWKKSDIELFEQLLMTGSVGNTFYVSQKENIEQLVEVIDRVLKKESPEIIIDIIKRARNEGFMRTAPIIALVKLRQKYPDDFKQIFMDVVRTGNDLVDFINLNKAFGYGYGRAVKTALMNYLYDINEFYAIKYRKQLADAMRIARPKTNDPIYDYIISYYKRKVDVSKALKKHPQIKYFEMAKKAIIEDKYEDAVRYMKEGKLEPSTLIGLKSIDNVGFWEEAMRQMGVMMLLKYLNKLLRAGVFRKRENVDFLRKKLTAENLHKAKVLPFRLVVAYMNLDKSEVGAMDVAEVIAKATDEYVKVYDFNAWKGRWAICPDVSGSMTVDVHGVKPAVIAGMFSAVLYKGIRDSILLPWDTKIRTGYVLPRSSSTVDIATNIAGANGGGTYMEAPIEYLLENSLKVDYVLQITDSEEWGSGWLNYWVEYKRRYPNAKAILLRVDPYDTNPFPPEKQEKYGILQIYGWSDNVFKWIEYKLHGGVASPHP